jgi:hypothetical protein
MSIKSITVVMTVAAGFAGLMAFGSDQFIAIKSSTRQTNQVPEGRGAAGTASNVPKDVKGGTPGELSRAQIEHEMVHWHGIP